MGEPGVLAVLGSSKVLRASVQVPATVSGYYPSGKENAYMAANLKMWQSFGFAAQVKNQLPTD